MKYDPVVETMNAIISEIQDKYAPTAIEGKTTYTVAEVRLLIRHAFCAGGQFGQENHAELDKSVKRFAERKKDETGNNQTGD